MGPEGESLCIYQNISTLFRLLFGLFIERHIFLGFFFLSVLWNGNVTCCHFVSSAMKWMLAEGSSNFD